MWHLREHGNIEVRHRLDSDGRKVTSPDWDQLNLAKASASCFVVGG
jgi:hypothetical protein